MNLRPVTRRQNAWYVSVMRDGKLYIPAGVLSVPPLNGAEHLLVSSGHDDGGRPLIALVAAAQESPDTMKATHSAGAGVVSLGWSPWDRLGIARPTPPANQSARYVPVVDERYGLLIYLDRAMGDEEDDGQLEMADGQLEMAG